MEYLMLVSCAFLKPLRLDAESECLNEISRPLNMEQQFQIFTGNKKKAKKILKKAMDLGAEIDEGIRQELKLK